MLEVLETKKNILLFFPYVFRFDTVHENSEAIESIVNGINADFAIAFEYREKEAEGYDTFLTCIYGNEFLIFKIESCKIALCDSVSIDEMPTFIKLREYTSIFE